MSLKSAEKARAAGEQAGDCIDCRACINACPTGVDIRDGLQLGCIQCGLCIDACDAIMEKVHRAPRLIGYDTSMNITRRECGEKPIYKPIRVRTVFYALLILATAKLLARLIARSAPTTQKRAADVSTARFD